MFSYDGVSLAMGNFCPVDFKKIVFLHSHKCITFTDNVKQCIYRAYISGEFCSLLGIFFFKLFFLNRLHASCYVIRSMQLNQFQQCSPLSSFIIFHYSPLWRVTVLSVSVCVRTCELTFIMDVLVLIQAMHESPAWNLIPFFSFLHPLWTWWPTLSAVGTEDGLRVSTWI